MKQMGIADNSNTAIYRVSPSAEPLASDSTPSLFKKTAVVDPMRTPRDFQIPLAAEDAAKGRAVCADQAFSWNNAG